MGLVAEREPFDWWFKAFSCTPLNSMDGRRAGYGVQLPMANDLRNEASIKPQMMGFGELLG